jgi:hypothetical protein
MHLVTKLTCSSCDISLYACSKDVTPKWMTNNFKILPIYLILNPFAFIPKFFLFMWNPYYFLYILQKIKQERCKCSCWLYAVESQATRRTEMALTFSVLQTVAVFIWWRTHLHIGYVRILPVAEWGFHCAVCALTSVHRTRFVFVWLISWEDFMS